jgi:hypothetical protein
MRRDIEVTRHDTEVTRRDILDATRRDLEATRREFESQLAAVKAQTTRGSGNVGISAERVKPPKFLGGITLPVRGRGRSQMDMREGRASARCVAGASADVLQCPTGCEERRHRWGSEGPLWRPPAGSCLQGATDRQDPANRRVTTGVCGRC